MVLIRSLPPLLVSVLVSAFTAVTGHAASTRHVDRSAIGTGDGTSWTNAYTNLQDALAAAQPSDEIWVADGTYTPDLGAGQTPGNRLSTFQLKSGVRVYGGFPQGGGDGTFAARAIGSGGSATILSGDLLRNDQPTFGNNAENAYHVVRGIGADSSAILDGFKITAANGNGSTASNHDRGGGITCQAPSTATPANPVIRRCHFVANRANQGSAIYVRNSGPVIEDCHFSGNEAESSGTVYGHTTLTGYAISRCSFTGNSTGNSAGALYNNAGSPTITDCLFERNLSDFGGGIYISQCPGITFAGCSFRNNHADVFGGAVYNTSSSAADFINCIFEGNSAESGAGIHCGLGSSAQLQNCRFDGNAAQSGAGIYAGSGTQLTATNCRFRGNNATPTSGGAVYLAGAMAEFTNCAFSGNAGSSGGALLTYDSNLKATNCSFQGNQASTAGGAIHGVASGPTLFRNCLIWKNAAAGLITTKLASVFVEEMPPASFSHSFVENFSDDELNETGSSNLEGTAPAVGPVALHMVNPLSATVVSGDLRLAVGSLGMNAGDNTANSQALDLAGAVRIQGAAIDLGAYEGGHPIAFDTLFPDLEPTADANGNGIDNFTDYAAGKDPQVAESPELVSMDGLSPVFRQRAGATDVGVLYQKARELNDWVTMVEDDDYSVLSRATTGSQLRVTIAPHLGPQQEPKMFYRAVFQFLSAADP